MHDDTQPSRIDQMTKALSNGQFPVRLVGDLGYGFGYPLFNFYAPFPYYAGAIFNLAGFDVISSTKIMFGIGILLSGVTMFFLVREIAGVTGGMVSAVLYMYAPYHAVDIYVRGAVGEFYGLGFLPLILLGIIKILRPFYSSSDPEVISEESRSLIRDSSRRARTIKQGILIESLGFAAVLLSHNILGMITGYFLVAGLIIYLGYLLVSRNKLSTFYFLLSTFILGFGLSAFFSLPAIVEKKYTRVEELTSRGSNFQNHFVYLDQLWNSPWGFAGSAPGRDDGMSFIIGKIHLILGLSSLMVLFYLQKKKKINKLLLTTYYLLFIILLISIFLMLEPSKFIWKILPGFSFIQYPWRFLSFTAFSLSFISSLLLIPFKKSAKVILSILMIIFTILLNIKYFSPKEYLPTVPQDYTSSENLRYKISKISDEYLPKEFTPPKTYLEIPDSSLSEDSSLQIIETIKDTPTEKTYLIDSKEAGLKLTNIAYFPGWKVFYSENLEAGTENVNGRLAFYTFPNKYIVTFKFTNTPIRLFANTISLFSLFLLVYVLLFWKGYPPWQKKFQSK